MKAFTFFRKFLCVIALFAIASLTRAQDTKTDKAGEQATIKSMIDAHKYVFKAQSASPTRGRIVQLTSDYDVAVTKDTVRSYLPYFGRAYSAPIDGKNSGIEFTSKDFEYLQKDRKKGGWDITIKPKDVNDVREMFLTIFDNGTASLRVSSNNREPISFNGYVVEK
jgi:Domain of unknown function (DUF4251)